jgi:hypothetical protein
MRDLPMSYDRVYRKRATLGLQQTQNLQLAWAGPYLRQQRQSERTLLLDQRQSGAGCAGVASVYNPLCLRHAVGAT